MKDILFFIFDNMTDYEVTFAMHMLNTSGNKNVVTIAYENKEIVSRSGAIYRPHRLVKDERNYDAEGLIICGGWYGDYRLELEKLINKLDNDKSLLAGICGAGTYMLAKSGVLNEVLYTTPIIEWSNETKRHFGDVDPFPRNNYRNVSVMSSENVITSLGHTFINFTAEILDWFDLFESVDEKSEFISFMKE